MAQSFRSVLDRVNVFTEGIHAYRRPSSGNVNDAGLRRYLTLDIETWRDLGEPKVLTITVEAGDTMSDDSSPGA